MPGQKNRLLGQRGGFLPQASDMVIFPQCAYVLCGCSNAYCFGGAHNQGWFPGLSGGLVRPCG
jgi:hypothetical protein